MAKVAQDAKYSPQEVLNNIFDDTTLTIAVSVNDASGNQITSFGASTADGATFTQNSSTGGVSMGVYQSSPDTLTTGKSAAIGLDINRNTKVREQYQPGYEDNTNSVAKVEHQYSYKAIVVADSQIKATAGFLHTVTFSCADAAPTAGDIKIFDSASETGTVVFHHNFTTTPFMPFTVIIDSVLATGGYIGFTTVADVNVSCSYR